MSEKIYLILHDIHPEHDFRSSKDFIQQELIDSFDVIELVSMIEDSFGVRIDGIEIRPENFVSIQSIVDLIERSRRV